MAPLTLIQTADMHGRLTLEIAHRLRDLKLRHSALLLDCGDALRAPNYLPSPVIHPARISPVAAAMNAAGYDAMAMGNREYGWRHSTINAKLAGLHFPVLSANIVLPDSNTVRPTLTLQAGESTVGIFALTPDMAPTGSLAQRTSDIQFIDPEQAARSAIADLRTPTKGAAQPAVIIALMHWGVETGPQGDQARLIEALPDLDIVLAGHAHVAAGGLDTIGPTTISRCASHAREAAILRLDTDGTWHQELVKLT
jgi:2',3'-cyclic-nucleotide 2'-phosphodiesterase (5'-nucleotidase family)